MERVRGGGSKSVAEKFEALFLPEFSEREERFFDGVFKFVNDGQISLGAVDVGGFDVKDSAYTSNLESVDSVEVMLCELYAL